ncbi:MAG: hypothetical protein K1X89_19735 [Myxococcaceae bacterium]|nr:hypothetical protein [Myxococcaceae bacterium]
MKRSYALICVLAAACAIKSPIGPTPDGGDAGQPDAGQDGGPPSGADGGLSAATACTVLNARRCEALVRCGLLAPTDSARRRCLANLQATWCGPTRWPARVQAGSLRYDAVQAQACADGFTTQACGDWRETPAACGRFLAPNAFPSQACFGGYAECTDGVCRGAGCPRSCLPKGALAEVCRETADCRTGLYCRLANLSTGVGQCVAYATTNQACDSVVRCAPGLSCYEARCVEPPLPGSACLERLCTDDAYCAGTADGGRCTSRLGPGASCTDDEQCQAGTICEEVTARCAPLKLSSAGSGCGPRQQCPAGTACLGGSGLDLGTCQSPKATGQACGSASECAPHLSCVAREPGAGTTCGPHIPAGGACVDDADCELFAVCKSGTCLGLPLTGESCTNTLRCLVGPCAGNLDAGVRCLEPYGPGTLCKADGDCAGDGCLAGKCLPACAP